MRKELATVFLAALGVILLGAGEAPAQGPSCDGPVKIRSKGSSEGRYGGIEYVFEANAVFVQCGGQVSDLEITTDRGDITFSGEVVPELDCRACGVSEGTLGTDTAFRTVRVTGATAVFRGARHDFLRFLQFPNDSIVFEK